jgi:hypothetical protein
MTVSRDDQQERQVDCNAESCSKNRWKVPGVTITSIFAVESLKF